MLFTTLFVRAKIISNPDILQQKDGETNWYIHATEYLLRNKMGWTIGAHNLDEFSGNYAEWKKLILKGYALYDPFI